jgi:hypothetical protein
MMPVSEKTFFLGGISPRVELPFTLMSRIVKVG